MDFAEKYPKSQRVEGVVEDRILWTGRVSSCFVCGGRTGFHFSASDCPSVSCCSDGCKATALEWESKEDPDFELSPSSSEEESEPSIICSPVEELSATESLWYALLQEMLASVPQQNSP